MGVKMVLPGVFKFDPDEERDDSVKKQLLIKLSNLPHETERTKRLFNFEDIPGREKALEAAIKFIRGEIQPPIVLFYGEPGRSKTHLALAIAWNFISELRSVAYYQVVDLLDALRQGYTIQNSITDPKEYIPRSFNSIINFINKCDLLVLDDIGIEKETDWVVERLDTVVNHRYERNLPIIITSNTLEISDRILDRCRESAIVMLEGQSYREIVRKRKISSK